MTPEEENNNQFNQFQPETERESTSEENDVMIRGWAVEWKDNNPRYHHDEALVTLETIMRLGNLSYLLTIPHVQDTEEFFTWHDDSERAIFISYSLIKNGSGWTASLLVSDDLMNTAYRNDPFPFLEHLKKVVKTINAERWQVIFPKDDEIAPHDMTKDHEDGIKNLLRTMGPSTALLESSISAMHGKDVRLLLIGKDPKELFNISHSLLITIPVSLRNMFSCAVNIRRLPTSLIKIKYKIIGLIPMETSMDLQSYVRLLEDDSEQSTYVLDLDQLLAGGVVFLSHPIPWLEKLSFQLSTALKLGEEQRAIDVLSAINELDEIVLLEHQLSHLPFTPETIQRCFNATIIARKHDAKHLATTFVAHGIKIACTLPEFTETLHVINTFLMQFKDDEAREEILLAFRKNLNVSLFENSIAIFHANWIRWFHQLYTEARENNAFRTRRELTKLWMILHEHLLIDDDKILPILMDVLNGFHQAKEDMPQIIFALITNEKTPLELRIRILKESITRHFIDEEDILKDPFVYLDEYITKPDKFFRILTIFWLSFNWPDPIETLLTPTIKKIRKREDVPLLLKHVIKLLHDVLSVQTFDPKRIQSVLSDVYKPMALNDKDLMKHIRETISLIIHDPEKYFDDRTKQVIAIVEREYHVSQAKKARQPATRMEHLKEAFKSALLTPDPADEQQILTFMLKEKLSIPRMLELGAFLINEIKKLGQHAALHLTTTLYVYTTILSKTSNDTSNYKKVTAWIEEAIAFCQYFKFKNETQQHLLITLLEESIKVVKKLPSDQQQSLVTKLLVPWSKITDDRHFCHVYKSLWHFMKEQKDIEQCSMFFIQSNKVLEKASRQVVSTDQVNTEKNHEKITKLANEAQNWKNHEKDKKKIKTADGCIKMACKFNDSSILSLIIHELASPDAS